MAYIPKSSFAEVDGIYQRPNGEVVLFNGNSVHIISYPSMDLVRSYSLSTILGNSISKVNSVLSTNTVKTYIFTDNRYLFQIDECSFRGRFLGDPTDTLNGLPRGVEGAFRYINGRLYYLTNSGVLEYEFTGTVTGSATDPFDVLEIICMRQSLLSKL